MSIRCPGRGGQLMNQTVDRKSETAGRCQWSVETNIQYGLGRLRTDALGVGDEESP